MAGELTKMARCGTPRVGNDSGGRFDAEERAHGRGCAVDLGRWELAKEIGWTS